MRDQSNYDWNQIGRIVVRKPTNVPRLVGVLCSEPYCLMVQILKQQGIYKKKFKKNKKKIKKLWVVGAAS